MALRDSASDSISVNASDSRQFIFRLKSASSDGLIGQAVQSTSFQIKSRASHRKSRSGCTNCKDRRVKCDEGRPGCLRCARRGVICNYAVSQPTKISTMSTRSQPAKIETGGSSTQMRGVSVYESTASLINSNLMAQTAGLGTSQSFSKSEIGLMFHFETFTCQTLGETRTQKVYRMEIPSLAVRHIYLMHAVLSMAALHVQHLQSKSALRPSPQARYHWQRCLGYFRKQLACPIEADAADAMLVTSTLVNGLAFAMIDASEPKESWPLAGTFDDLRWLSLQGGISLVLQATQPINKSSAVGRLFAQENDDDDAPTNFIPSVQATDQYLALCYLCGVTPSSDAQNNHYLTALTLLRPLLSLPCTSTTIIMHLSFIGSISATFVSLLRAKDHRALLIFACWYAGLCEYECWWTVRRSTIECRAIVMYLEKMGNAEVRGLLGWPARKCGYLLSTEALRDLVPKFPPVDEQSSGQIFMPCIPM